jgi:asparagine synthase (glutamine-hydrolysing)
VDCLLDPAGRPQFRRLCDDIGALAEASRWRVAWRAFRRSREAARPFRWPTDLRYVHPDAQAGMAEAIRHPWLDEPGSALPGRAAHIAMLVAAQGYVEDGPHGTKQAAVSPLVSQPLIEHCLRIPSWDWFAEGRNRAAARRAFERDLPHEIAWRRGKGTPDGLIVALVETNRRWIRDHLGGGLLARAGVIDVAAILDDLDDRGPARGTTSGRILQLADAESWARGIMAQNAPHSNAPP